MGTPSGETKLKELQSYCQASFLCFSPCFKTQSWAAEPRGWQESERNAGHD